MNPHRRTVPAFWVISIVIGLAALRPQASQEGEREGALPSEAALDAALLHQLAIPARSPDALRRGKDGARRPGGPGSSTREAIGLPNLLDVRGPLSAALLTTVGGRDTQFSDVSLIGDWDGREDCTADRSTNIHDFSGVEPDVDFTLTRTAISEHTIANGFTENVYYYGDSVGNVYVAADTDGNGLVDDVVTIHLPTVLNAFGTVLSDDQIVITGLGVNPVADLSSFSNVNGAYAGFAGQVGEILYVSYLDTGAGLRLASNNILVRGGLLAFPVADVLSPAAVPPGVVSHLGFPVTVGAAFGVAFTVFSPLGGLAVDDDGSVYFAQADLIQRTGANIVKVASLDTDMNQDRSLAVSGILTITSLNPAGGQYGSTSGPASQVNRFTNYSGTSSLFGNVVALASGSCNVLYAALARSNTGSGSALEGLFPAPAAHGASGTPAMIISFADCTGAFDACSGVPDIGIAGLLPVGNGIADAAVNGVASVPGVNNFRAYVLGYGPDLRPAAPATSAVWGNSEQTLKLDLLVDFTIHAGLALSEADKLFVISGGTPAGIGLNPSPSLTEVLCFEDSCPADRRADFVDYRGDVPPNPPLSGGNVGDGDSDRFDHIFAQAPVDGVTFTPTGLSGLARGFLLYLNRTRNDAMALLLAGIPDGTPQGDDATTGPIAFEAFDASHAVAGGDDQFPPFRGDDSDGGGDPRAGGFEFSFGAPGAAVTCAWNEFHLNSNGNLTFGVGDTDNTPTILELRSGAPRIAPAWSDLNPAARVGGNLNTFPVQALGFADVNAFEVRWINVPEFGKESCGSSNTLSVTLLDDGSGSDENSNQPLNPANPIGNNAVPFDLQEGPTDLVWERDPLTGILIGCTTRREGRGQFRFEYCRMDLLGTTDRPVLSGYSVGGLAITTPPGLCEINLSEAAREADAGVFGVIQGMTASVAACLIGEGTEPTIYEYFNEGSDTTIGVWGEIFAARPDFDLRAEGNDALACTPVGQLDPNRGHVDFLGTACTPPASPNCLEILPVQPVQVAPNQPPVGPGLTGIVNALCAVELDILGCGFYPNEVTTVCAGSHNQRPGKTVTTAVTLSCDTNGDGIPENVHALTDVAPLSDNHIRATLPVLPTLPGTAFGLACCGGNGVLTVTTTFSAGDNNQFGPFTRTTSCAVNLGTRAPVVLSVTPSGGDCSILQDVLISGACLTGASRVFAVEFDPDTQTLNHGNTVDATAFVVLNANLIDALFDLRGNSAGTFMIFVTGPGGTSRNLTQGQTPAGCVSGNEQGVQVTFTCQSQNRPPEAVCRNVTKTAGSNGYASVGAGEVDGGSYDPDGDSLGRSIQPAGPFAVGSHQVTLTVTDGKGGSDTCIAWVTVNPYSNKPKVRIGAVDAVGSEPGNNRGVLRIARSGSTAAPLTVFYTVGGTATAGSDYFALSGSATIPIGKGYVDIVVRPKDDAQKEAVETVIATLAASAAYQVWTPSQATVSINDND
ncbi:MAG TPA: hypothetical protein VF530_12340 [Planctomycetota bacterium]